MKKNVQLYARLKLKVGTLNWTLCVYLFNCFWFVVIIIVV